ncbi:MAG: hypothetical protein ABIJ96_13140 [Elusimicrobiota bacterium]
MLIPIAALFLPLSMTLLLVGTLGKKPAALHALKCLWLPGLVAAAYLTFGAWKDRAYSENWAFMAVLYFVFPYTVLLLLEGLLEFFLLRGRRDKHARASRIATAAMVGMLLICSIIGALSA